MPLPSSVNFWNRSGLCRKAQFLWFLKRAQKLRDRSQLCKCSGGLPLQTACHWPRKVAGEQIDRKAIILSAASQNHLRAMGENVQRRHDDSLGVADCGGQLERSEGGGQNASKGRSTGTTWGGTLGWTLGWTLLCVGDHLISCPPIIVTTGTRIYSGATG